MPRQLDYEMAECPCVAHFRDEEERSNNDRFVCYPHYVGKNILIYGKKNTSFPYQCMVGPHWPITLFTYVLILVPTFLFIFNVAIILHVAVVVLVSITFSALLISFTMTACSDPGIVYTPVVKGVPDLEVQSAMDGNGLMECNKCLVRRPYSATHCYDCELCIDKLDHHCPWTGKCIGRKNIKYFYAFLTTLFVHVSFVAVTTLYFFSFRRG